MLVGLFVDFPVLCVSSLLLAGRGVSGRLSLSRLWGRDGERPSIWDKRLGGGCCLFYLVFFLVFFGLCSCFQPVLFDIGGCADALVVNIHAMSCGKDLDSGCIG